MPELDFNKKEWTDIGDVENTDMYIITAYACQVEGVWQYAIVHWRYTVPTVLFWMADGKKLYSSED